MDLIIAFALGAGVVIGAKHGRRALLRAAGWAADKAGWISGHAAGALEDVRRVAQDEFLRARSQPSETVDPAPTSTNGVEAKGVEAKGAKEASWR
jgi:hypothetical protein